jgi:ribosomal protein L11 methylase PrmA
VHLHARSQRRHAARPEAGSEAAARPLSPTRQAALLDSLVRAVAGLRWTPVGTEWAEYGTASSYDAASAASKDTRVAELIDTARPTVVWDLGANTGRYSAIAARSAERVVALDIDPAAGERHWQDLRNRGETRILPILQDLANPSPAIGWDARERLSLFDRSEDATLLALALVHHLAIGRNVPLPMLSATLARLGRQLIIEWVPKDDPMVQRLLATREDIFPAYTEEGFRAAFDRDWEHIASRPVAGTPRTLHLMRRATQP